MAKLRFSLLCMAASVDYRSKSLSVMNVLDAIQVDVLPTIVQSLEHVSVWDRDEENEEIALRVKVFDPENKVILPPHEATLKSEKSTHRYLLSYSGFLIQKEGDYRFVSYLRSSSNRWRRTGETSLRIRLRENK